MKKIVLSFLILLTPSRCNAENEFKVGWLGAITGGTAKYGTYQAAMIAEEDINKAGGIAGRPLKLIFEDGKGTSAAAVPAVQKLLAIDQVRYLVGGHCTPESLPIAPIVQSQNALMIAAITSSPKLSDAGDNIFRVTAVSTTGVDLVTQYVLKKKKEGRYAALYEQTDYVLPLIDRFKENVSKVGGSVSIAEGYLPGEADFRSILTKIKSQKLDGIYVGVQAPDAAVLIFQQMRELGLSIPVFGNEITGNAVRVAKDRARFFDGLVFAEPEFDTNTPKVRHLIDRFKEKFNLDALPYGFWTAEAYDAVMLLADTLNRCGIEVEAVKKCLYQVNNYIGASGSITIDSHGDGIRHYLLKKVEKGEVQNDPVAS